MSSPIIVGLALREDDEPRWPSPACWRIAAARHSRSRRACPARFLPPLPPPHYANALLDQTADALEAIAKTLPGGEATRTHAAFGPRAGVLHALAEELQATAIVVGSTHRGDAGRVMMGDVAAGLLHGSTCPVVVAPRGYTGATCTGSASPSTARPRARRRCVPRRASRPEPAARDPLLHRARADRVDAGLYDAGLGRLAGIRGAAPRARTGCGQHRPGDGPAGTVATSEVLHGPIVATLAQASERLTCWSAARAATERCAACWWAASHAGSPTARPAHWSWFPAGLGSALFALAAPQRGRDRAEREPVTPGQRLVRRRGDHGPGERESREQREAEEREHARGIDDGDEAAAAVPELDVAGWCHRPASAAALALLSLGRIGASAGADSEPCRRDRHDGDPVALDPAFRRRSRCRGGR